MLFGGNALLPYSWSKCKPNKRSPISDYYLIGILLHEQEISLKLKDKICKNFEEGLVCPLKASRQ
jgi:hypothetical protein